jgi:hypothetical protein
VVRNLRLKRRRTRVPWVYVVYHPLRRGARRTGGAGWQGRTVSDPPPPRGEPSALAAQKRGNVERRIQIEAVLVW